MKDQKNTNETVVKSVRMRTDLADRIETMARQENRNFSNMTETLLLKTVDEVRLERI